MQAWLCLGQPSWQASTSATGVGGSSQSGRDCSAAVSALLTVYVFAVGVYMYDIRLQCKIF